MLKKVDVGVYDYLTEVNDGTFPSGPVVYDLASDGVGYSTSGDMLSQETIDRLEEFKQQIIDGEITVPTEP
jgi:basic membrane protein A